jgi:hypothetical protein
MTKSSDATASNPCSSSNRTFDAQLITFYWEGARVSSPATFTTDGTDIKVNGIGALPAEPADSVGMEAALARTFSGLHLVDSLVARGSTYGDAVDRYGCEMGRRLRRALLALSDARASQTTLTRAQLGDIAATMGIGRDSIRVFNGVVECVLAGGAHIGMPFDSPDSVLNADPCATPSAAAKRVALEKRIASMADELGKDGYRLLVGDGNRIQWFTGPTAAEALDQVTRAGAIYKQGGAEAVRRECKDFKLPPHALIAIARRQGTAAAPR